jgi:peptidoglycan/LPS O-acetylase OafA/YrhL
MKSGTNQRPAQTTQADALENHGGIINFRALDIGRILAASVIFYFHIGLFGHYPFSSYGEFAVEYFVILSGVSYILFSKSRLTVPSEYYAYIKRRWAALFPMFLLVNVAIYLGSFFYASVQGRPFTFVEFLASAAGISQYLGWKYMSTVMWFFPFIMQVYLLLPLIDWTARRINPVILVLLAFGVSCLLAQTVPLFVRSDFQAMLVCKNWSPVLRLPEVCVGIILGRTVLANSRAWDGILAVVVFGMLSLAVSLLESANTLAQFYMPWEGFWVPAVLLGVAALLSPVLHKTNMRLLRGLGIASYSFFLLHAAPLAAINHHFQSRAVVWAAYYLICWSFAIASTQVLAQATKKLASAGSQLQN